MRLIATATIDGPEAKGPAALYETDMNYVLKLDNIWIAYGAPDVYLALTTATDGAVDGRLKDVSMLGYHTKSFELIFPKSLDPHTLNTVLVYCRQFRAHFGHGVLDFTSGE